MKRTLLYSFGAAIFYTVLMVANFALPEPGSDAWLTDIVRSAYWYVYSAVDYPRFILDQFLFSFSSRHFLVCDALGCMILMFLYIPILFSGVFVIHTLIRWWTLRDKDPKMALGWRFWGYAVLGYVLSIVAMVVIVFLLIFFA